MQIIRKALASTYTLPTFLVTGRVLFAMARVKRLEPVALRLARGFAWLVHSTFGRRKKTSAEALAREWNRLMPRPRSAFPIIRTENETAYVEIRIHCPLRGTQDAMACWRSMEFDRALMKPLGGALVVMESQSVTGGSCCKLAIRRAGADFSDLPVAHPRWRAPAD